MSFTLAQMKGAEDILPVVGIGSRFRFGIQQLSPDDSRLLSMYCHRFVLSRNLLVAQFYEVKSLRVSKLLQQLRPISKLDLNIAEFDLQGELTDDHTIQSRLIAVAPILGAADQTGIVIGDASAILSGELTPVDITAIFERIS